MLHIHFYLISCAESRNNVMKFKMYTAFMTNKPPTEYSYLLNGTKADANAHLSHQKNQHNETNMK